MKNIVVTGATSMIGVATIEACIEHHVNVYAVVRRNSSRLDRLPPSAHIKIIQCDLCQMALLPQLIHEPCDVFYHFAWGGDTGAPTNGKIRNMDRVEYNAENIRYTVSAVVSAKALGCRRFIGAGSQAEYGIQPADALVTPRTPVHPQTAYGIAKYAAGRLAALKARELDIGFSWVRIYSVYGIHDRDRALVKYAIRAWMNGETPVFSAATQMWNYLYSRDAGDAFRLIGQADSVRDVYCLANSQSRPLMEYIKTIRDTVAPRAAIQTRDEDTSNAICLNPDISDLVLDTGFQPAVTFQAGINSVFQAMKRDVRGED